MFPRLNSTTKVLLGLFGAGVSFAAYKAYQSLNNSSEQENLHQEPPQQPAENAKNASDEELEAAMKASLEEFEREKTMRANYEAQVQQLQALQEAPQILLEDQPAQLQVQHIEKQSSEKTFQQRLEKIGCEEVPEGYCCLVNFTVMTNPVQLDAEYNMNDSNMVDLSAIKNNINPRTRKTLLLQAGQPIVYKELKSQIEAYVVTLEKAYETIMSKYNKQEKIDLEDQIREELNTAYEEIKEAECNNHQNAPEPEEKEEAKLKM